MKTARQTTTIWGYAIQFYIRGRFASVAIGSFCFALFSIIISFLFAQNESAVSFIFITVLAFFISQLALATAVSMKGQANKTEELEKRLAELDKDGSESPTQQ
jgi:c-di-AMP phosphodiesterase-like protein